VSSIALLLTRTDTALCYTRCVKIIKIEARAPDRLDEVSAKAAEALSRRFGSAAIEARMNAYVVSAWSPRV